jgi:hypothetical protein
VENDKREGKIIEEEGDGKLIMNGVDILIYERSEQKTFLRKVYAALC